MNLAMGKLESSPFDDKVIRSLRLNDMDVLEARGMSLVRDPTDRSEVQVDCRFTQLLVTAAEDPEISIGTFAGGVRVGARLPRLPALHRGKTKWRLLEQSCPLDNLEEVVRRDDNWRINYSSIAEQADKEVMNDQATRGLVLTPACHRFARSEQEGQAPQRSNREGLV